MNSGATSSSSLGYAYDIFVSYSTRDLEWVRSFHEDLVNDVNRIRHTGPDIKSFLDKARLQPGYRWDEELLSAASDSAILIPVLSPRFLDSDYCQKEVNAFLTGIGSSSDAAQSRSIMPVKLLCAAPDGHVLARFFAESFCRETDRGMTLDHPRGSPEYHEALRRLSFAIDQTLANLRPKARGRPAVYLATNFKPEADKLRASLEHHFDVLPVTPQDLLGFSPLELQQALERDFAQCFVSVHALGHTSLVQPLVDAQLDFARTQDKTRLVWSPTQPDDLTNDGFEWFRSQADIENRIRRLNEKPAFKPGASRLIYFLCSDRPNKTRAEKLLDALEDCGVHVYPSPLEGEAEQALSTHIHAIKELDGCLIYYGDVDRSWFDGVFPRIQKEIRNRSLPSAIFVAPPPTDHKRLDLRNIGMPVLAETAEAVRTFLGGVG